MKRFLPFIAAVLVSATVLCGALAVGLGAALNPDGVRASDSAAAATTSLNETSIGKAEAQVAQLQSVIQQYQAREKQYQDQLAQAQATLDSYQQILTALQNSGLIRIMSDGRILVRTPAGGGG